MLDHVSDGRFIFGIGRGLAPIEYDGFRVDQNEGRNLFVEHAELIMNALEKGYMEGGAHTNQPRREIRPFPFKSFKGRTYAAAVSPESMPIMAKLGVGLLVIPQKPWEAVKVDFEIYHRVWREVNGAAPAPKPLSGGFVFVDENKDRAEAQAMKWLSTNYKTVIKHYEMTSDKFGTSERLRILWSGQQVYRQARNRRRRRGFCAIDAVGNARHGNREAGDDPRYDRRQWLHAQFQLRRYALRRGRAQSEMLREARAARSQEVEDGTVA